MRDLAPVTKRNSVLWWKLKGLEKKKQNNEAHTPRPFPRGCQPETFPKWYLKSKSKNLISLKEKRFITCHTVLKHSIYRWSILLATETWGAGREAPEIKKKKTLKLLILSQWFDAVVGIRLATWKRIDLYIWGTIRIFNVAYKIFCVEVLKSYISWQFLFNL